MAANQKMFAVPVSMWPREKAKPKEYELDEINKLTGEEGNYEVLKWEVTPSSEKHFAIITILLQEIE